MAKKVSEGQQELELKNSPQTWNEFIHQNATTLLTAQAALCSVLFISWCFFPRKSPLEQSIEGLSSAAGALMSNTSKLMKYGQDFATATQPITDGVYSASSYAYGCVSGASSYVWSCFGAAGEATTKMVGDVMDAPH